MASHFRILSLICLLALATTPAAQAQTLALNDYSYDTVCDFTGRYFMRLKRRIEPREWDAIVQGKGKPVKEKPGMLAYSHRGLKVRYSHDENQRPHIWQVDLDQPRVSESLRTLDQFNTMFNVTPEAVTTPTVTLECDGQLLIATFDKNRRVKKLSLRMLGTL